MKLEGEFRFGKLIKESSEDKEISSPKKNRKGKQKDNQKDNSPKKSKKKKIIFILGNLKILNLMEKEK